MPPPVGEASGGDYLNRRILMRPMGDQTDRGAANGTEARGSKVPMAIVERERVFALEKGVLTTLNTRNDILV